MVLAKVKKPEFRLNPMPDHLNIRYYGGNVTSHKLM